VDAYREQAETVAEQLSGLLQERVDPAVLSDLGRHADADAAIVALPLLQPAMATLPKAEVVGLRVTPSFDVQERVARLGTGDLLGLVTRSPEAVAPIVDELRALTGFRGQLLALPIEGERRRLETLVRQADLILYTPQVRRRLRPLLGEAPALELTPVPMADALTRVRDAVGR